MGKYTVVSQSTFAEIQADAGVILKTFDPANPEFADENIVCATSGGINPTCTPTFSDFGEDIDNISANMLEFKRVDGFDCAMAFTALNATAEMIRMTLGAADVDATSGKITPRKELKKTDFTDIWWVGDRTDGGFVAICLKNALSTGGFSLQTTKNGKGQISVTLSGHVSIDAQDEMPMEFYVIEGEDVPEDEGTEE